MDLAAGRARSTAAARSAAPAWSISASWPTSSAATPRRARWSRPTWWRPPLSAHGAAPDVLAGLLSGEAIATWCAPPFGPDGWRPTVEASRDGDPTSCCAARRARWSRPVRRATCSSPAATRAVATQVPGACVPATTPGVTVSPMQTVDLTRRFGIVTFDDVRVPADAVVGAAGEASADVDRQFQLFLVLAQRGVGRGHADRVRHDGRVGLRPLLLRAAARLVPGPEAPVRRHDELARGEPRHQRAACAAAPGATPTRRPSWSARPRPTSASTAPSCSRTACSCTGASGSRSSTTCTCSCAASRRPGAGRDAGGPPPAHRRRGRRREGVAA